jgi:hypothetical protein
MRRPRLAQESPTEARRFRVDHIPLSGAARLTEGDVGAGMRPDMLARLREDPGGRTLGQLLLERQWALQQIERLTGELLQLQRLSGLLPIWMTPPLA